MKNIKQQLSSSIVDDKATDKIKKRAQEWGLIVNAGVSKAPQPPTTKDATVK